MEAKVVTAEPGPGSVKETTDEQLVAASRAGDTRAFRELYDRHVGVVHGVVRWNVDDELESEELTQEVFIRAWEKLGQFEGRSALSTWLVRIAINSCRVRRRSLLRRDRGRVPCLDPSEYPDPSEGCPREDLMDLERAIRRLPRRARMVLVLAEIFGYRHAEIAEMMGTSIGTCKAQLSRAKRLLRGEVER